MAHIIAFYPPLVEVTGDHASAVVLSQIMYWHQGRLRVIRHGKHWLAKSREAMCEETGVTLDQYKRIIPALVKQGFIITERGLFKGKVTPHIQLTKTGHKVMQDVIGGKPTNPLVAYDTNVIDLHIIQTESTNNQCFCETSFAKETKENPNKSTGVDESKKIEEIKEVNSVPIIGKDLSPMVEVAPNKGWLMKATEILKHHKDKVPLTGSLGSYWKSRCALVSGKPQKNLTIREHGQLKHLSKALEDQTRPVIAYVVEHWWKFATKAGYTEGTSFPTEPHIGFLLKHYDVALNLLMDKVPAPAVSSLPATVQSVAPTEPEVIPPKLTPSELSKLLEDLKSP